MNTTEIRDYILQNNYIENVIVHDLDTVFYIDITIRLGSRVAYYLKKQDNIEDILEEFLELVLDTYN